MYGGAKRPHIIHRWYAHFDLPYTDEEDAAIRRFRAENPKGKHGQHHYTLDEYGLDEDEVRERFRRYTDAYGDVGALPLDGTREPGPGGE